MLVLVAYSVSDGSDEPARPRSLAGTFTVRLHKVWVQLKIKKNVHILVLIANLRTYDMN